MTFDAFITVVVVLECVLVGLLVLFSIALALWGGPFRLATPAQIEADWRRAEAEYASRGFEPTDGGADG